MTWEETLQQEAENTAKNELENISNIAFDNRNSKNIEIHLKILWQLEEHMHNYRIQIFKHKAFQKGKQDE